MSRFRAPLLFAAFLLPVGALHAQFMHGFELFQAGKYCQARAEWLASESAEDTTSPFGLAELYARGLCVEKNERLASRWYLTAAIRGHARGRAEIGYRYALGRGVRSDVVRAYVWLSLSKITAGGWEGNFVEVVDQNLRMLDRYMKDGDRKQVDKVLADYRRTSRLPLEFYSLD